MFQNHNLDPSGRVANHRGVRKVIAATAAVLALASCSSNKNDQSLSPSKQTTSITFGPRHTETGEDCASNRLCFYNSYQQGCSTAAIKTEHHTPEGDPVYTYATVSSIGGLCVINIVRDGTQDKFSNRYVQSVSCRGLYPPEAVHRPTGDTQTIYGKDCPGFADRAPITEV